MTQTMTGGCMCGAKRFTAEVGEEKAYLCHCRMCQRATGNVSIAMVVLPTATISWNGEPNWYRSSAIAERPFCATCGTSLGFRYLDSPEKMDLTVASFDDPSVFKPHGFLTRDSRIVERKKYGKAKARRSFQFSKR